MFKNALICHQECVYGKFVALKDPRIAPFKKINCAGYVTLRPTRKIGSLGIGSCLLARYRGGMVPEAQGHRRPSLERPRTSKACRAGEPGLGPSRRPGEVRTPSRPAASRQSAYQAGVSTFAPPPPRHQQTGRLHAKI